MNFRAQGEHLLFDISPFYNDLDIIAWECSKNSSQSVGDLTPGGLEVGTRYQSEFKKLDGRIRAFGMKLGLEL